MADCRILISRRALSELRALPGDIVTRISKAIDSLGSQPRPMGSRKLQEGEVLWRVRVGDYRVICSINDLTAIVEALKIAHRSRAYR